MSNINETTANVNIRTDADGREWLLTTNGNAAYRVFYDKRAGRRIFVRQDWHRVPGEVFATEQHYEYADVFSGDYMRG